MHQEPSPAPRRAPGILSAFPKVPKPRARGPACDRARSNVGFGSHSPLLGWILTSLWLYDPGNQSSASSIQPVPTIPHCRATSAFQSRREIGKMIPRRPGRTQQRMLPSPPSSQSLQNGKRREGKPRGNPGKESRNPREEQPLDAVGKTLHFQLPIFGDKAGIAPWSDAGVIKEG